MCKHYEERICNYETFLSTPFREVQNSYPLSDGKVGTKQLMSDWLVPAGILWDANGYEETRPRCVLEGIPEARMLIGLSVG